MDNDTVHYSEHAIAFRGFDLNLEELMLVYTLCKYTHKYCSYKNFFTAALFK